MMGIAGCRPDSTDGAFGIDTTLAELIGVGARTGPKSNVYNPEAGPPSQIAPQDRIMSRQRSGAGNRRMRQAFRSSQGRNPGHRGHPYQRARPMIEDDFSTVRVL